MTQSNVTKNPSHQKSSQGGFTFLGRRCLRKGKEPGRRGKESGKYICLLFFVFCLNPACRFWPSCLPQKYLAEFFTSMSIEIMGHHIFILFPRNPTETETGHKCSLRIMG